MAAFCLAAGLPIKEPLVLRLSPMINTPVIAAEVIRALLEPS